ncbi:MAG: hypothetical protein GWP03_01135 [Proteobacteria bacterium]|nr:hypothetical protein [Pseudomonadota bacterium]
MVKEKDIRAEIVYAGKRLKEEGLITSTDGNISIRFNNHIFITPSGYAKGEVSEDDIVKINLDAKKTENFTPKPSMEFFMHQSIYKRRPDIEAIIHTHAPFSTSFAVKGIIPDYSLLLESELLPGAAVVGEFKPGSMELAREAGKISGNHDIMLLKKHGIIVLGKEMKKVLESTERFEFLCKINIYSRLL